MAQDGSHQGKRIVGQSRRGLATRNRKYQRVEKEKIKLNTNCYAGSMFAPYQHHLDVLYLLSLPHQATVQAHLRSNNLNPNVHAAESLV